MAGYLHFRLNIDWLDLQNFLCFKSLSEFLYVSHFALHVKLIMTHRSEWRAPLLLLIDRQGSRTPKCLLVVLDTLKWSNLWVLEWSSIWWVIKDDCCTEGQPEIGNPKVWLTYLRTDQLTWVGARDTCVSKKLLFLKNKVTFF